MKIRAVATAAAILAPVLGQQAMACEQGNVCGTVAGAGYGTTCSWVHVAVRGGGDAYFGVEPGDSRENMVVNRAKGEIISARGGAAIGCQPNAAGGPALIAQFLSNDPKDQ